MKMMRMLGVEEGQCIRPKLSEDALVYNTRLSAYVQLTQPQTYLFNGPKQSGVDVLRPPILHSDIESSLGQVCSSRGIGGHLLTIS